MGSHHDHLDKRARTEEYPDDLYGDGVLLPYSPRSPDLGHHGHDDLDNVDDAIHTISSADSEDDLPGSSEYEPVHRRTRAQDPRSKVAPVRNTHEDVTLESSSIKIAMSTVGRQTAKEFARAVSGVNTHWDGFRFLCPLPSCIVQFHTSCTYDEFRLHAASHSAQPYAMDIHPCPLGCQSGFVDAVQLRVHLISHCPNTPAVVYPDLYAQGKPCDFEGCSYTGANVISMRHHYFVEHSFDAYGDDNIHYKDHICQRGFYDGRSSYEHIVAKPSTGCHLQVLLDNPDIYSNVVYQASSSASRNDILRSAVCRPVPTNPYKLADLADQDLTIDELLIVWEQLILGQRMAVQFPEITAGSVAGCAHHINVTLWKIPSFTANMRVNNPTAYLLPSVTGTSSIAHSQQFEAPLPHVLRRLYPAMEDQCDVQLITIFRHSQIATKDHDRDHMSEATRAASQIHRSGIARVAGVSIVCAGNVKGCFVPSFANHLDTEVGLAARSLTTGSRNPITLRELGHEADRASEITLRVKSQIIGAIMEKRRPV